MKEGQSDGNVQDRWLDIQEVRLVSDLRIMVVIRAILTPKWAS